MAAKPSSARGGPMKRSDVSGFYKKSADERWQIIREFGELESSEIDTIRNTGALRFEQVDHMIENVVGAMPIPLGIAVNFQVNGKDYLVPMAIEEPSVVAAASNAARMARERGGFTTSGTGPIMLGQIQLVGVSDPNGARMSILAVRRLARARAVFAKEVLKTEDLTGEDVVEGILEAYAFADADPFRCATHNKGIMNGVDAVVLATGNDWRAIEAGAHAYAAWKSGGYRSLTTWEKDANGDLVGTIELPMAVGLVGGATAVHPTAKANVRLLGVKSAQELGEGIAAVGLAQNFAALRALATEGIQRGHMSLHARNIAASVGAVDEEGDRGVEGLVKEHKGRMDRAKEVLAELRAKKPR